MWSNAFFGPLPSASLQSLGCTGRGLFNSHLLFFWARVSGLDFLAMELFKPCNNFGCALLCVSQPFFQCVELKNGLQYSSFKHVLTVLTALFSIIFVRVPSIKFALFTHTTFPLHHPLWAPDFFSSPTDYLWLCGGSLSPVCIAYFKVICLLVVIVTKA